MNAIKVINRCLLVFVCSLGTIVFVSGQGYSKDSGAKAFVWSSSGNYLVVDESNFETLRSGNIWDDISQAKLTADGSKLPSGLSAIRVVADFHANRAFVLLGIPKAEEYMGFLVFRLSDAKPVGIIRESMSIGPVTILPAASERKLYITFLRATQGVTDHIQVMTTTYDASSLRLLQEHSGESLQLGPSSCVLSDGRMFYANGRLFDAHTSKVLRESRFLGKPYIAVDCEGGRVLLVSQSPTKTIVLTVYDPASDKIVSEIATASEFRFNDREWRLSRDGRIVIQDEQKTTIQGNVRMVVPASRLVLYDVQSSSNIGEIRFPGAEMDAGIVDQSADGRHVFYHVSDKLYVADLTDKKIVHEFQLNFVPIGVIWP